MTSPTTPTAATLKRTDVPGVDAWSAAADACLEAGSSIARPRAPDIICILYVSSIPVVPHKAVAEVSKIGNL